MKPNLLFVTISLLIQHELFSQSDFEINSRSGTLSIVEQIESVGENLLVRVHIDDELFHYTRLQLVTPDGIILNQVNSPGPGVGTDVAILNDAIYQFIPEDGCDYWGTLFSINRYNAELFLLDNFEAEHSWDNPYFLEEAEMQTTQINLLNDSVILFSNNKGLEFYNTNQHSITDQIEYAFGFENPSTIVFDQDSILVYTENGIFLADNGLINQISPLGFSYLTLHNSHYYGITPNNDIQLLDSSFNVTATLDNNDENLIDKICFDAGKVYALGSNFLEPDHLITLTEALVLESEIEVPETDLLFASCFHVSNGRLYLGGTNYSEDLMYGSDCIKSYSVDPSAEDFQEDIGVTDFILNDYYFTPIEFEGGPTFYSLSITGIIEVTNFTDHPVENASACVVSFPLFYPWCSNLVHFFEVPTIGPNETIFINTGDIFYSTQFYSANYGQTIETDLCFSTHAPNLHMDDVPENDSYCETVQVTVTGIDEERTSPIFCYYNGTDKAIHFNGEAGGNFEVYDALGQKIRDGLLLSSPGMIQADEFSPGIYIVSVKSNGTTALMKVLVY